MSKRSHTAASAAAGIEQAIRMLEGRWKLLILFHRAVRARAGLVRPPLAHFRPILELGTRLGGLR